MSKRQGPGRIYTHVDRMKRAAINEPQSNPRRVVMSQMNRKRAPAGLTTAPLMTAVAPLMRALLCTAAFMATGAIAGPQAVDSINVSYMAADLTQPEGARSLYLRIQRAARVVCREPDIRELAAHTAYERCYERAVDDAVAKVDATALTALHRSKTQRSAAG
jgi:UrcA family protein